MFVFVFCVSYELVGCLTAVGEYFDIVLQKFVLFCQDLGYHHIY